MSETQPTNGAAGEPPSMSVLAQYLKDLSFESPRAPHGFIEAPGQAAPGFEVDVNVNARGLGGTQYEIELSMTARARRGDDVMFIVESTYAGAFDIRNLPEAQLELVMLVECPRLLFPFLRQIVADATRNGNFPPLMLEPIDFLAVYHQRRAQQAPAQGDITFLNA